MSRTARLIIRGRVQAVGYRAWALDQATRLGLAGWVRNRADGTVEAVATGDDAAVERFIAACRSGPGLARVTAVDVSEADPGEGGGPGFEFRPTV
ncbi:MAG: acylphosphatase [Proteobacteria bacterium]|nr:acylphosphatase [Pseudomonadota bacterium]